MKTNSIGKSFTIQKILIIDFQNFHISWKASKNISWAFLGSLHNETIVKYIFHEMLWKKYFTVYPRLKVNELWSKIPPPFHTHCKTNDTDHLISRNLYVWDENFEVSSNSIHIWKFSRSFLFLIAAALPFHRFIWQPIEAQSSEICAKDSG